MEPVLLSCPVQSPPVKCRSADVGQQQEPEGRAANSQSGPLSSGRAIASRQSPSGLQLALEDSTWMRSLVDKKTSGFSGSSIWELKIIAVIVALY